MFSSSSPPPLVRLVLLMLLVIVHATVRSASSTRTPENVKSEDDSASLAAAICQTKLFILLDTAVTVPFFASPVLASRSPMLQRFTPVNGTLEYVCDENSNTSENATITATVKAFLRMNNNNSSTDEQASIDTLSYEAVATLDLANRSVSHRVVRSNRLDYQDKVLIRKVEFDEHINLLTLTPEEKMFGVAFALLWTPSNKTGSAQPEVELDDEEEEARV